MNIKALQAAKQQGEEGEIETSENCLLLAARFNGIDADELTHSASVFVLNDPGNLSEESVITATANVHTGFHRRAPLTNQD